MLTLPTFMLALATAAAPVPAGADKADTWSGLPASTSDHLPVLLLRKKPIQDELKLNGGQLARLKEIDKALLAGVKAYANQPPERRPTYFDDLARDTDAAIAGALTAEQYRRFRELFWQVYEAARGPTMVATNPVAAKVLGLTDEQKKEFAGLRDEFETAMRAAPRKFGPAAPPAADSPGKVINEKVVKALTTGQKKKWNEMQGEPFQGQLVLQPGMRPITAPARK